MNEVDRKVLLNKAANRMFEAADNASLGVIRTIALVQAGNYLRKAGEPALSEKATSLLGSNGGIDWELYSEICNLVKGV
jgi:hypothetical protein